jgi:hypothetical protein
METYLNLGGNSGVEAYEIGENSITVQFKDGAVYEYNHRRPGRADVEQMKELAQSGRGLNSFISTYIREDYYRRVE